MEGISAGLFMCVLSVQIVLISLHAGAGEAFQ